MSGSTRPVLACHVVTHVHWDREWYRPFESFRARLVGLVETVCDQLDSGRMDRFHLDGQTATVADVVDVRPDLEVRVSGHVRAGRLTIGPWHVLADNQLVSAETLVRNLELGGRWVRRLGGRTGVGYSPDAFGHPADLPRVLAGFGAGSAVVWRGAPPDARFRWRSPDGSEVLTVNQGYHEAQVLWRDSDAVAAASAGAAAVREDEQGQQDGATWAGGGRAGRPDEDWVTATLDRLADFVERERGRAPQGPLLLLDGGDHILPLDPVGRLDALRAAARERCGVDLVGSDLDTFVDTLGDGQELPVVDGELRRPGGWLSFLLSGTLSTRSWLKQANDAAQAVLERFVEPGLASAALAGRAGATELAQLDRAWELVLHNVPHDSVCGCSVDEVHRENASRAERVQQIAADLTRRQLLDEGADTRLHGLPETDHIDLLVRNPHARPHTGPVEVEVVLAPGQRVVALLDPDGHEQPVDVVPGADAGSGPLHFEADVDLLPDSYPVDRATVAFVAREVPALGWSVYRLRCTPAADDADGPGALAPVGPAVLDTADDLVDVADGRRLAVADDGSLRVVRDGVDRQHLLRLLDDGDRGDSYTHDPLSDPPRRARILSRSATVTQVRTRLVAEAVLELPGGLVADRTARDRSTVTCPVRITATAWAGLPGVQVRFEIDNRAEDHRLRVVTPAPGATSWSGLSHWSMVQRPMVPEYGPRPEVRGHEAACGVAPVHGLLLAGRGEHATAVLARGLPEGAGLLEDAVTGPDPVLAVTLLRGVGWLSRPDLRVRTAAAGPMLATPDAQVQGPLVADLAVLVGDETLAPGPDGTCPDDLDPRAALALATQAHRTPLVACQLRSGTRPSLARGPGRGWPAPELRGALLSAFVPVPSEAPGAPVAGAARLRIWNPTPLTVRADLIVPSGTRAVPVRLDGTAETVKTADVVPVDGHPPERDPTDRGSTVVAPVLGPWQVRTFTLARDGRAT